ncbi:hypothetical protein JGS6364_00291 [[Clostridium] sordellii]|uniref:hypothetical protein n=1 Tax=Paraclostridium sordellii TaxID=1505 RepID=UPI00054405D9|nr:hypothetical protein [Paeniclostridium sordellii]CEK29383.1 hypothetical protein JGS6364_00291 [[Clostridium] sordellii] [Paeniclostridium sordellii]
MFDEKIDQIQSNEEYEDSKNENIVFIDYNNIKAIITEKRWGLFGAGYIINIINKIDKK